MESSLPVTASMAFQTVTKTFHSNPNPWISHLHRRFYTARACRLAHLRLSCILDRSTRGFNGFGSISLSRNFGAVQFNSVRSRLECVSSSAASFASDGGVGGNDSGGGGGGGGDGPADGGKAKLSGVAGGADDSSVVSTDVIILDVGGMTCGGCAASVKRILESQPQVSSASVNLTTETAVVWPVSDAKVVPNWQKQLGEALAKHLTNCGFKSNLRGEGAIEGDIPS